MEENKPHSIITQCNYCKQYHEYTWNEFTESYHGYCDKMGAFMSKILEDIKNENNRNYTTN